jgi:hypothetical protein
MSTTNQYPQVKQSINSIILEPLPIVSQGNREREAQMQENDVHSKALKWVRNTRKTKNYNFPLRPKIINK